MDGQELYDYFGGLREITDEKTGEIREEVACKLAFKKAMRSLKVVARCSPQVKYALTKGLKENGVIAVTGSSISDVPALIESDIGVALSNELQSEAAKDAS